MTTTLEELLTMMAEDQAKAVPAEKRPPPVPPKKVDAIGNDEIESLDDGPVLKGDRLWPSALPQPARRGPPPPPPGRRARGTAPGAPDNLTSGLIDVRAMAMAYEQARATTAAEPVAEDIIKVEPPPAEPPPAEPEVPKPVIAEGTKPFPTVEEAPAEPEPEPEAEPAAAEDKEGEKRAAVWPLVARRAAGVAVLLGAGALVVVLIGNRVRSGGTAAEPEDYTARLAASAPIATAPSPSAPAEVAPAPVVIAQPTTITEVSGAVPSTPDELESMPPEAPVEAVSPPVAEVAEPAVAVVGPPITDTRDESAAEIAERAGPGEPPPELLADGCFDAACATTAPRVKRPAPPAAEVITVPARLPTRPSASEIASGIFSAQDQIDGCGDVYGQSGAVPIKIRIAPDGAIASVAVNQGTTRFRTCVADIVRRVRMPASLIGTTASFPVLIR